MSLETSQTEELELNIVSEPEQVEAEEISSKNRFAFFTNIKKAYVKYITRLGAAVCYMVKHTGCAIAGGFVGAAKGIANGAKKLASFMKAPMSKIGAFLAKPFVQLWNKGKDDFREFKSTYKNEGKKSAAKLFFKGLGKFLCGSKGVFVTAFNYLAPVVSVVFLVALVNDAMNAQYGLEVQFDNDSTYVIADESVFDDAQKIYQENAIVTDNTDMLATFTIQRLSPTSQTAQAEEIADMMLSNSIVENNIVEATGVYLNGELLAIISNDDVATVEATLNNLLKVYESGIEGEKVYFLDEIKLEEGLYSEESIEPARDILSLFTSKVSVETYYTIEAGDAPIKIAEKNGLTLEELTDMNPEVLKTCFIGDKVILSKEQPYLSVCTSYTVNYDEVIDYEIIEVVDETMYIGAEYLIQSGSEGLANRTAEVILVNGYETTRNILEETILEEAVPRKIKVGGKTYSGATVSMIEKAGKFMWPLAIVQNEYVSSRFGYRAWDGSYHAALDIAAPRGTPIYASADGYVSMSQYRGSYGNLVVLDHQNGYETYYAHCHALYVTAGSYVKKGDLIAIVGTTGSSSGYHLHFEVRYNGTKYDPLDFMASPVAIRC